MTNRLYYGDNLDVLRDHIASDSVDLIYLDPPFNSNANYNILFKSPAGKAADSQIEAFEDSWHWNDKAESAFHDVMTCGNTDVAELLRAMRGFLKENDMMAYLAMMAVRLIELHRVLKPTGSLYLHCDPTASHYLKLLLDGVFGGVGYRNEIIWKRSNPKSLASINFPTCTDTIFRFAKSDKAVFYPIYEAHDPVYVEKAYRHHDEKGVYRLLPLLNPNDNRPNLTYEFLGVTRVWRWTRERMKSAYAEGLVVQLKPGAVPQYKKYLEDSKGRTITNCWTDIPQASGKESLGYPTQKPLALLERILNASSNEGDVVLDPFCGCGTAVDAAQKLGRQWIGIDVTHLAIGRIEWRLQDRYGPNALAKGGAPPLLRHPELVSGSSEIQGGEAMGIEAANPSTTPAARSPSPDGGGVLAYEVIGTPNDLASAEKLAADEPHQFQYWITQAIDGQPYQGGRKGADRGIDGYVYFTGHADDKGGRKTEAAIISVKAGRNVGVAMVRDLKGVVEREKAPIGIFVCVINPTREMEREAASAGVYEGADGRTYPKLQLYTIAEYFSGLRPKVPLLDRQAASKRAAVQDDSHKMPKLL